MKYYKYEYRLGDDEARCIVVDSKHEDLSCDTVYSYVTNSGCRVLCMYSATDDKLESFYTEVGLILKNELVVFSRTYKIASAHYENFQNALRQFMESKEPEIEDTEAEDKDSSR